MQVHDEIICEIHDSELESLPFLIHGLMEDNSLEIPLRVDIDICKPSWATKEVLDERPRDIIEDYIEW